MNPLAQVIKLVLILLLLSRDLPAQFPSLNVHHLTTVDGLGDGVIRAIGQDRYGYMWIGTVSGLSRFDGFNVKLFQSDPRIPGSPPSSVPRYIFGDSRGLLWFGFNDGFYRFRHGKEIFEKIQGSDSLAVTRIFEHQASGEIILLTSHGVAKYNAGADRIQWLNASTPQGKHIQFKGKEYVNLSIDGDHLYILTATTLYRYTFQNGIVTPIAKDLLPENQMQHLATGRDGTIWVGFADKNKEIRHLNLRTGTSTLVQLTGSSKTEEIRSAIREIFVDHKNRLWVTSANSGIALVLPEKNLCKWYQFIPNKPNAFSPFHTFNIFQGREGYIWLGTEGYGVDYFHPDKALFEVISGIEDPEIPDNAWWARAVMEDRLGNFWMAWAGGASKYDAKLRKYFAYENYYSKKNIIYNGSVRSLLEDADGMVWIGTATGVNKYNPHNDIIEFPTAKDSLPESEFYWNMLEDHQKNIWYGTGTGLHYRNAADGRTYSYKSHPVLANAIDTGVRVIYEDSRKRIWFGMNGTGLLMYDPAARQFKKWTKEDTNSITLLGNTITALHEDRKGIIWISSFNGLVSYDPEKDVFKQYTHNDKLPSVKCSGILSDDLNRLWIGTTSGLVLLDANRKHFTVFTIDDGLPSLECSDMPATKLRDGKFVFPTIRGFIRFDPMQYSTRQDSIAQYISSIKIFDKQYNGNTNTEALTQLYLKPNENFFSFQLVALNYHNSVRTWYAYKLDGFDKDWIISNTGVAHYTNVPGGNYVFRYKASVDPEQWDVPEKQLTLYIGTYFYNTWWFYILVTFIALAALYIWYSTRINQQKKLYSLRTKAQMLEKEKALVKFEGLKQQLNPHFLFNSLSSLASLIRTNQQLALTFLDKLSKTYRYILQSRDLDLIPLEEEIRFASSYISLLGTRFQDGLKINMDIEPSAMKKKVVPVILQNMIDNAIKHNMIDHEAPLELRIFTEDNYLVVRNNIQRKTLVETSNKQGLNNLLSLYHYLTDHPMIIEEQSSTFTVKIPLI